jgi:hypothetical protein
VRSLLSLAVALGLVGPSPAWSQEGAAPAQAAAPPQGAKVWVGRYAEFEDYLRTAPIERMESVPVGVTKPLRALFTRPGLAASAAVKVLPPGLRNGIWESYRSEIAAYELDRILGLDMVPVTVERRVNADLAAVQLWIEGTRTLNDLDQRVRARPTDWAIQICRQRVFDNLVANIDRNAGNLLVDGEWNLILIDHSRAFATDRMPFAKKMTCVDRALFEKLKALDEATLSARLEPWVLSAGTVRELLKRRDMIVAQLERLARERGAAAVFPF